MCIILPTDKENNQEQTNLEPSIAAISAILGSRGECWKTSIITCFAFLLKAKKLQIIPLRQHTQTISF